MTRIPVPTRVPYEAADLPASVTYFPLVGVVVGAATTGVFFLSARIWPNDIAVVLSVIVSVLITGAFHEDALADALDGFGGGWNREQVLAIMKDSRVGSYALVGVVLVMMLKVAALLAIVGGAAELTVNGTQAGNSVRTIGGALIAAHVLGRWSSVLLLRWVPYVRSGQPGEKVPLGGVYADAVKAGRLLAASAISVGVVVLLYGRASVALLVTSLVVTALCARYFTKRIGGVTGDALGAANMIVEVTTYLALAAGPARLVMP